MLSRHMVANSGTMEVDCFGEIFSDEQIFVALVSGVWPRWRNKFLDLLHFFFKIKQRNVNDFIYSIYQMLLHNET